MVFRQYHCFGWVILGYSGCSQRNCNPYWRDSLVGFLTPPLSGKVPLETWLLIHEQVEHYLFLAFPGNFICSMSEMTYYEPN